MKAVGTNYIFEVDSNVKISKKNEKLLYDIPFEYVCILYFCNKNKIGVGQLILFVSKAKKPIIESFGDSERDNFQSIYHLLCANGCEVIEELTLFQACSYVSPDIKEEKRLTGADNSAKKKEVRQLNSIIKKTIIVSNKTQKKVGSTVGRGLVWASFLGPVGLLAGLTGKSKNETTFLIIYEGGKRETVTTKTNSHQFNNLCKYLE